MSSKKNYLFTSESVSCGHPDKLADQISDAILDEFLKQDEHSRVACETFITDGLVLVGGEVHSNAYVDIKSVVKQVLKDAGYNNDYGFDPDNFGLISTIHEQSSDIRNGVDGSEGNERCEEDQGAGDQGMMFGYATNETPLYMPAPIVLAHTTMQVMDEFRSKKVHPDTNQTFGDFFGPDAKCQYTLEYDGNTRRPTLIKTIIISTQHKDSVPHELIEQYVLEFVIPTVKSRVGTDLGKLFDRGGYYVYVNPSGRFVIGGPKGDTGLTGRKIIVDTYGGSCPHGGGAFSGKDASKVDRSGAYMARFLAKNVVASGIADECTIQISYAIGCARPVSVYVNTNGTSKYDDKAIADTLSEVVDMRPGAIIKRFGLTKPIFRPTATYGHFGRHTFESLTDDTTYFAWEKVDYDLIEKIKVGVISRSIAK